MPQWLFTKNYLEIQHEEVTQKVASAYDNIGIVGIFVVIVGSVRLLQALSWGRRFRLTFFAVAEGALPGAALNSMTGRGEKLRTPELESQTQPKAHWFRIACEKAVYHAFHFSFTGITEAVFCKS